MTNPKDAYKIPDGFDPDTNNYQGLPVVNITMCMNQTCPDAKRCRRHKDSGAVPKSHAQTYNVFNYGNKRACPQYHPLPHKHIGDA